MHMSLITNPCNGDAGSNPTKCNIIFEVLGTYGDISDMVTYQW
jgi:hypothetical protein